MTSKFDFRSLDFIELNQDSISININNVWANRGHLINEGMISPDSKYFYLNLPKNSSSFVKKHLADLGWAYSVLTDHPSATTIVVLRDPLERWISGAVEYLFMYHLDSIDKICEPFNYDFSPLYGERLGLSLLFDRITFDDHTERQCMFLKDLTSLSQCIWLNADQDFNRNFSTLLSELGYPNNIVDAPKINYSGGQEPGTLEYKREKFQDFLRDVIAKDRHKQYNIRQWLWCDYQLMSQIKFYNAPR